MKVYEIITNRILEELQKGSIPWRKPWTSNQEVPKNLITKKEYRGINVWMLKSLNYESPYFLSFKQAQELGGSIRKGEHGIPVVFWKWLSVKQTDPETQEELEKSIPYLRYYTVFNVAQTEGIPTDKIPTTIQNNNNPIEACEKIVKEMPNKPDIKPCHNSAYYVPSQDYIAIPSLPRFNLASEYYATLFHEMVHSTGHESRLNRKGITNFNGFGTDQYGKEELIAEMGASFLCGVSGIENKVLSNSVAYINAWMQRIKKDSKLIIVAAAQAQKATDYILGKKETN
jgi:antirestriction protein ArdC